VDTSKVVLVPGWYDTSLTETAKVQKNLTAACAIFIDCDLYESVVPVFRFITSLIQDGTVIIIDDYFRYKGSPERGIQKAFNEWLAENPHLGVSELERCSANRVAFICYHRSSH
jgi:predicted O-methyltransferase YrrM